MRARDPFDSLVIGAGVGGLSAAARLAAAGLRPLVVEGRDRVGGRFSSTDQDGFRISTGAVAVEYGGVIEATFGLLQVPFCLRVPHPAAVFRYGGKDHSFARGGWTRIFETFVHKGAGILARIREDFSRPAEVPETSLRDWLLRFTEHPTLHGIFQALAASIFAVNADEIPARSFFDHFMVRGGFKRFGFPPSGCLGLMESLAGAIKARGGEVRTGSTVERILVRGDRVIGAVLRRQGLLREVQADVVFSNAGPRQTAGLIGDGALPAEYLAAVRARARPAANVALYFTSARALVEAPGIVTFVEGRRLCNLANLGRLCPELTPRKDPLYVAFGVPRPSLGPFDADETVRLMIQDLEEQIPEFRREARILSVNVMQGDWPAQRACAGYDLPQRTPIRGLWNVGDGVKPAGWGGASACAESARLAVEGALAER